MSTLLLSNQLLDAEDRQDILEAVGELATVQGSSLSLLVTPPQYGDPQVVYSAGDLQTMNPYCMADSEEVVGLAIAAGENGTVLGLMGREYRVLSIEPARSGFSAIELGAV